MNAIDAKARNDVWQILTIDALSSVNDMTQKSLERTCFLGKNIGVLKADSVQQAQHILQDNSDIAAVLLDAMADSKNESLDFIHFIRTVLKNDRIRIILRTGYPDTLPDISLIQKYEIDGYIPKETMSAAHIEIAIMTAIRAYHQIVTTTQVLQTLAGSIAHEMRNPLGQIKYSLDMIAHNLPTPSATLSATPSFSVSGKHLNALYQQVSQGQLAIKRGLQVISMILGEVKSSAIDATYFNYLSAAQTTQKALDEYAYETESERRKVSIKIVSDFTFKGDETIYLFILFNLIKNALYYFKLHPNATLTITIDQSTVKVRDTGPGIAQPILSQLFRSFETSGKAEGTGLGLAYCKRAMQAFCGTIVCDSIVGEYTEFTLSFPVVSQSDFNAYQQAIMQRAAPVFEGKRILIVDDDAGLRKQTQRMLSNLPCCLHIEEAQDGQHALEQLKRSQYDLIVMDLNMPRLDGYASAEKIRAGAIPHHQSVPIVAHTSESAYIASIKTRKVGMNGFVSKPCSQLELVEALRHALEQHAVQPENTAMQSALAGKTVLLADDELSNRRMVRLYLQERGVNVIEEEHGQAVLDRLASGVHCDALLMDLSMPGLGGLETTKAIRTKASSYQHIPIIALTGYSSEDSIKTTQAAGMNDFITKPVEAAVLYEKLGRHFSSGDAVPSEQAIKKDDVLPIIEPRSKETSLLDPEILEGLRSGGVLVEYLSEDIKTVSAVVEQLETSVVNQHFQDMHDLLHRLIGITGYMGAVALPRLIKQRIYPPVADGRWPEEENWLEQIKALTGQTIQAWQTEIGKADVS